MSSDAVPPRIANYLALLAATPHWTRSPPGGIEILLDPPEIMAAERATAARYLACGLQAEWAEAGIHYRDPYLLLVRDAVRFPGGELGIHHRILRGTTDPSGVAVLPRLPDGRILLLRHFRHATRRFHWEVPRGGIEAGSDAESSVHAELAEEIGARVRSLVRLGTAHGASGLLGLGVALYLADTDPPGAPAVNEGIVGSRAVTPAELDSMLLGDEITDAFTLACVTQARVRGLLPSPVA